MYMKMALLIKSADGKILSVFRALRGDGLLNVMIIVWWMGIDYEC